MKPRSSASQPQRVHADSEEIGRGLGRLVVAVLDIIRQLLERQALRRVEGGGLSDEQVERLGLALLALEDRFAELRDVFGVTENDLDLPLDVVDPEAIYTDKLSQTTRQPRGER